MKKEIKQVDSKSKTFRITTIDERWYSRESKNRKTGLPEFEFRPSSSWVAGKYPKGIGYMKWLAEHGWDEAEAIKRDRGESGSKVHQACEIISLGKDVHHEDTFTNSRTLEQELLTPDEYEAVLSYKEWLNTLKNPEIHAIEFLVWADRYAGTGDLIVSYDGKDKRETTLVDLKTSQYVWPSHTIQLNSYFHAPTIVTKDEKEKRIDLTAQAILQVGYKRNKCLYKFTEVTPSMEMFEVAYRIWELEHGGSNPKQRDFPLVIDGFKVEKPKKK